MLRRFALLTIALFAFHTQAAEQPDPTSGAAAGAMEFAKAAIKKDADAMKRLTLPGSDSVIRSVMRSKVAVTGAPTVIKTETVTTESVLVTLNIPGQGQRLILMVRQDGAWKALPGDAPVGNETDKAELALTRVDADIENIKTQLQFYEVVNGGMPSTAQGLAALVKKPEGEPQPRKWRQLLQEVPLDSWGTPYQYANPATKSKEDFDLFSAGPDKKPGTADDIGNW